MPLNETRVGMAAIALAISFNVPFALLSRMFDYPAILRRPTPEVLDAFHAKGPALVSVWYLFMITAFALVPLAIVLAAARAKEDGWSLAAVAAAICGALAGFAQAVGLARWVFVVPTLASQHADPAASEIIRLHAEHSFQILNLYAGVAIGEHLGQALTAAWIAAMLLVSSRDQRIVERIARGFGIVAILAIVIGLGDGLTFAFGQPIRALRLATVIGYLALTGWLISTGLALLTNPNRRAPPVAA